MQKKILTILKNLKAELSTSKKDKVELEKLRLKNISRYTDSFTNILSTNVKFPDAASFLFIYDEIFEKEIYKFKSKNDNPLIIDCGANIGLSIIYFKKNFPKAKIIAFEPDDKIFKYLEYNINSFELSNVELYKKACWNKETTINFFSEGADAGRTANENDKTNVTVVETTRLKNFLKEEVEFLKIDIEGAEFEVLEDAKDLLFNVNNIFVEYHSFTGKEQKLPELVAILKSAGFRLHISVPGLASQNPFIKIEEYAGMDNQLNIYGFR